MALGELRRPQKKVMWDIQANLVTKKLAQQEEMRLLVKLLVIHRKALVMYPRVQ
jgi:hypothetical protein